MVRIIGSYHSASFCFLGTVIIIIVRFGKKHPNKKKDVTMAWKRTFAKICTCMGNV